ncbi:MAG: ATP-binding protein [Deltaproteobacteria bacterium]|nr:ATP-binding protein [Deltaproteobacteria bacterium]
MKLVFLSFFIVVALATSRGYGKQPDECANAVADVTPSKTVVAVATATLTVGRTNTYKTNLALVEPLRIQLRKILSHHLETLQPITLPNGESAGSFLNGILLAFQEAFTNAVKYGNSLDPSKNIEVKCILKGRRIQLEVADESGDFFNPENDSDPRNSHRFKTTEENHDEEAEKRISGIRAQKHVDPIRNEDDIGSGGRGVLLINLLSHRAKFVPREDPKGKVIGTRVVMHWNVP